MAKIDKAEFGAFDSKLVFVIDSIIKLTLNMQNFFIAGVSGIGKSYLEIELSAKHGFYLFPKYTDRPLRPREESDGTVIGISHEEFSHKDHHEEFMFRLDYVGNRYGWLKQDFMNNQGKNITLQLPASYLKSFLEQAPEWMPILLDIEVENLDLLLERMKQRHNYSKLTSEERESLDKEFEVRLDLIHQDIEKNNEYKDIVDASYGMTFVIKDDETLYEEVIPFILENR